MQGSWAPGEGWVGGWGSPLLHFVPGTLHLWMQEAGRDAGEVGSRGHLSCLEPRVLPGLPAPTIPVPSSLRGNPHSWVTSDLGMLEPDWAVGPPFSPPRTPSVFWKPVSSFLGMVHAIGDGGDWRRGNWHPVRPSSLAARLLADQVATPPPPPHPRLPGPPTFGLLVSAASGFGGWGEGLGGRAGECSGLSLGSPGAEVGCWECRM